MQITIPTQWGIAAAGAAITFVSLIFFGRKIRSHIGLLFSWSVGLLSIGSFAMTGYTAYCVYSQRSAAEIQVMKESLPGKWLEIYDNLDSIDSLVGKMQLIESVYIDDKLPQLPFRGCEMIVKLFNTPATSTDEIIQPRIRSLLAKYVAGYAETLKDGQATVVSK